MKILPCLLLSLTWLTPSLRAHSGKHDKVTLPGFETNKLKGYASLRISQVDKHYVVAFSSPQFNFLSTDKFELTAQDNKKLLGVQESLKNPAHIFSTKIFQCSLRNPSDVKRAKKTRTLEPKMGRQKVALDLESHFSQVFANIASQYVLVCKDAIEFEKLKFRVFELAPKLQTLLVKMETKKGGKRSFIVERSQP